MAQVLRRRNRVQLRLAQHEREALLHVVDSLAVQIQEVLQGGQRAYVDDANQADFDRWVRPDIERGRDADIGAVRDALEAGEDTIILSETQAYCWLRALNHLRLAAGAALGISEDDWAAKLAEEQREGDEYRMLTVLSYLQEDFVAALEA